MQKPKWDLEDGDFIMDMGGNMGVDFDGHMMIKMDSNMAMDVETGDSILFLVGMMRKKMISLQRCLG